MVLGKTPAIGNNQLSAASMLLLSLSALALVAHGAPGGTSSASVIAASIPGAKTITGALASSADGMSRYLAPDGPIQPAITAIGGLPMRGAELVNNRISQVSSGFGSGAQSLATSAGDDGTIRMPGMDALESTMPASFANIGTMMHGAIQQKNGFIRDQAEKGVQAGERLRNMMASGLRGMHARGSGRTANMFNSAQETLMRGSSQFQGQIQQSLGGTMGRLQGVQGIGQNVLHQAQGIGQTLTNGLTGTIDRLQQTGQQVRSQVQGGLEQNTRAVSNIVSSMQGSMGNIGENMQKNLASALQQAQNAAQQLTSSLQQAATAPLNMIQSLGSSMMHGGASGGSRGQY